MKKLGLLALAAGMMGLTTTMPQTTNAAPQTTETGAKEALQPQPTKTNTMAQDQPKARHAYRSNRSTGGGSFFNPGIPPKDYGMRYVKRGTHKRSNV